MPISRAEYEMMRARHAPKMMPTIGGGVSDEIGGLHNKILKWAKDQFPQVPVIHCRPDKASRATVGAPDFALVWCGRVVLVECKTATGKVSDAQREWRYLSERQGVTVFIVRDYDYFLGIMEQVKRDASLESRPQTDSTELAKDMR